MSTAKKYTVSDLLRSVKVRGSVPEASGTFSNTDLLRFANEEIDENLGPLILSTREEFYLTHEDITTTPGKYEYPIPYRAYGSKIRVIKPTDGTKEGTPLVNIPLDNVHDYDNARFNGNSNGYYLKNDKIVLVSDPGSQTLRVYFYIRPNNLVELSAAGRITSINFTNKQVTLFSVPSSFQSNTEFDLIQSLPNHKTYAYDLTKASLNLTTKTLTFNEDLPSELKVGDYVCLAGETVVPQVPVDVIPILEQSVVCKVLESLGDSEGLRLATARLQKLEMRLLNIIDNRIESPAKKVVNLKSFIRKRWGY